MTRYFIRHGESTANADKTIAGRLDVGLTSKGMDQAHIVGKNVVQQRIMVDTIVASPLRRAYETAVIVAEEIGYPVERIVTSNLLVERDYGELQGKPIIDEFVNRAFRESLAVGMEPEEVIAERVDDALAFINRITLGTTLIVSHNGIGKRMVAKITSRPLSQVSKLPNAELIKLEAETSE